MPFDILSLKDSSRILFLAAPIFWACLTETAFGVVLAWDPSPDTNVVGYEVQYGTNSGVYPMSFDVGNQTNAAIELPTSGDTYYFVVTAYTVNGVDSPPSNEVSYTPPAPLANQPQTISFGALAAQTYGNPPFNLSATASSGLPVSYSSGNPAVATIAGSTVTIVGVGSTVLTASQGGNSNYVAAADVGQTLTVTPAVATVSLSGLNAVYDGTAKSATATTSPGGLPVNVTYNGGSSAPVNAGSYAVVASVVSSNYTGSASGTLTITQPIQTNNVPGALKVAASPGPGLGMVSFQAQAGETVTVQASEDLEQWKTLYQLLPLATQTCQMVDPDSAKLSKRFYRLMGTNVTSRKLQFSRLPACAVPQLSFAAPLGGLVSIQASDDRVNWTTLQQVETVANQTVDFVDPTSMLLPMRFYRLMVQGVPTTEVTYLGPAALRCAVVPGPLAVLSFPARSGETVSVQTSDDLGSWTTLYELHPIADQTVQIVDPGSGLAPQRFYRLMGANVASRQLQFSWLSAPTVPQISFVAPPGDVVQIQASEDLRNWIPLNQLKITTNQWVDFVDPASASLPRRFYRLAPAN